MTNSVEPVSARRRIGFITISPEVLVSLFKECILPQTFRVEKGLPSDATFFGLSYRRTICGRAELVLAVQSASLPVGLSCLEVECHTEYPEWIDSRGFISKDYELFGAEPV